MACISCRNCGPKTDINNSSLLLPFFPRMFGLVSLELLWGCLVLLSGAWSCCILLRTSCNTIAKVQRLQIAIISLAFSFLFALS
ncbi:unnamed protein product [Urochloa humidicola]